VAWAQQNDKTIDEAIVGSLKSHGIDPSKPFRINNHIIAELDMALTDEQYDMMYNSNHKSKRKAIHGEKYRWTNAVFPYEFKGNDFSDTEKREIRESMDVFEEETCLKFRLATASDVNKAIFQQGAGCNSQLGMIGGSQPINLDSNGCRWKGLYWHEIGHALGLIHEHQLPDRDKYIRVRWENVDPGMRQWFKPDPASTLDRFNIPYDLSSVMHYGIHAFSKLGGQTIYAHDKSKENWIGRVFWKMMSFTDVKILNKMYKCDAKCAGVTCPESGFVNKECKCVTPKSYFDSHCVNKHPNEDECYDWAKKGECFYNIGWMAENCRKACDRCPKFGMTFDDKTGDCYNKYFDDARCDKWAKDGECETYGPWMKRMCQRSCGTCGKIGICENTYENYFSCDDFAKKGECQANPSWMMENCADSCKACNYREKGKCKNIHSSDAECDGWAANGDCNKQDKMVWMKKNCASTCNTCFFGQGKCDNEHDDAECDKFAASAECDINPTFMKKKCKKSCNSCEFGIRGDCDNHMSDSSCEYWADNGGCESTEGWLKLFCPSACNACDFWKNKGCVDISPADKCKKWAAVGECDNNAGFMKYNCAKSCNSCAWLTTEKVCGDMYGETCKFWLDKGECQSNPGWMNDNCRKTCGACQAGEKEIGTTQPDKECNNLHKDSDCEDWAKRGECSANKVWMEGNCAGSCKVCSGGLPDVTTQPPTQKPVNPKCKDDPQCPALLKQDPRACNKYDVLLKCKTACGTCRDVCKDDHDNCAEWVSWGHCKEAAGFMLYNCQKSCNYC